MSDLSAFLRSDKVVQPFLALDRSHIIPIRVLFPSLFGSLFSLISSIPVIWHILALFGLFLASFSLICTLIYDTVLFSFALLSVSTNTYE